MFCSVVPIRDTHKSSKIVCGLRTPSVECSKLGKTRIITDASRGMEEILEFCFKEFVAVCLFWNFFDLWYSCNITYRSKEVYAYCGNSMLHQSSTTPGSKATGEAEEPSGTQ